MSWPSVMCAVDRVPIRILSGERSSQYINCMLDLEYGMDDVSAH
jgi:hypothetical protein